MVELCQHDGGRSVYKDWLDSRGPGLHHLGFRIDTREEFDAAGAAFEREGAPLAMGGDIEGAGVWAYFDTVDQLGCCTEIYLSSEGRRCGQACCSTCRSCWCASLNI